MYVITNTYLEQEKRTGKQLICRGSQVSKEGMQDLKKEVGRLKRATDERAFDTEELFNIIEQACSITRTKGITEN